MALPTLHGRTAELRQLLAISQPASTTPRLAVLFGRRRVGKSFLLSHLAERIRRQGDHALHYTATRESSTAQLARLTEQSRTVFAGPPPTSWFDLWTTLIDSSRDQPLTLLLDEVPYLIDSDPSWASVLQAAWDSARHSETAPRLTVVLTGSAISVMSNLVSSRGALFERPDLIIRLEPFDLPTAASFLHNPHATTAIEAYSACDGYPLLLSRWDVNATALDNLVNLASEPLAPLAANASTLLLDLADYDAHHRVLHAIGRGAHRLSEINSRAGQRTERPLAVLERAGFVRRRHPLGDRSKNSLRLEIADNYLAFWFAMVEPNLQLIDGGQGAMLMRRSAKTWEHLVAATFEQQARAHAIRRSLADGRVGEWWTDRPQQAQIDVVVDDGSRWLLAGEVKYKDRFGVAELRQLERHIAVAGDRASGILLAAWSKTGVSDDVRRLRPGLLSFTADDMVAP